MTQPPRTTPAMSCVLIGQESLLIGCGDLLLERGNRIAAVIATDRDIAAWARGRGIALLDSADDLLRADLGAFDWLLSIANLALLPDAVLALPRVGAINFHDGPLPGYAGLNTPAWALMRGETRYGVTWHMLEAGIDTGDIVAQQALDIAPDDTAFTLNSKCYAAAIDCFAGLVPQIEAGMPERRAQDLGQRRYFAKGDRPEGLGHLDFGLPAARLSALVRGLDFGGYWNPLAVPKITLGDRVLRVGSCDIQAAAGDAVPGTVTGVAADRLQVATATRSIALGGLTDLSGAPVDVTALVRVGDVLEGPDTGLNAALRDVIAGDAYWRDRLRVMMPATVPMAKRAGEAGAGATRQIGLPDGLVTDAALSGVMLWALRGSGEDVADLAYCDTRLERPERALPYVSAWLPMQLRAGHARVADLVADVARQRADVAKRPGFARDLMLRDPALAEVRTPPLGVSLGTGKPVAGTVLSIDLAEDGATATLHYDPAALSGAALDLLVARLLLVWSAMTAPETALSDIPVMPEAERRLVLRDWNATERAPSPERTIPAAFEAQVARSADAPALVFERDTISYGDLNARANRLAHVLRDMGAGRDVPVGLMAARGPDLLIGALAILKAGSAYVPLDPAYPADRIAHYIADSAAPILVVQDALRAQLPRHGAQVIALDTDPRVADAPATNLPDGPDAGDLAYLIYTSGSTGTPKGVMVEHGNVANFFAGMDDRISHDPPGVWLAVTSLSFDISVLELFYTLARGFKLVLSGDDSRTLVAGEGGQLVSDARIDFNLFYWGNDDGVGPKKYELLLEGAKFADRHGFNAVWTPERHFHAFGGPYPNPSVTGAAVAAVTQNLSVRAGSCVAPLHHPARIAEEWAVIDNLTDGRAGIAIASGWQPDDFVLRPENTPPANKPAMYAAIDQLRALWRGDSVAFPTRDGTPFEVVTQPRPVSRELPIWVTTAGNPETWREAGQIGANVLTHLLGQSIDEVAGKIGIYHEALRAAGHDPADHAVTVMLHTYLAETREDAARVARGPMKDYLRSAAGLIKQYAWAFPAFKKPQGVTNPFDVDLGSLDKEEMDAILDFAFERYFNDSGMFGTVEDGVARAEALKRIGVTEIACLIDYGIATDTVMAGLTPLAEVLRRANTATAPAADDFSIAAQIARHGVTHLQCTPSMAQMLVTNDVARGSLARIEDLMIGGEALPGPLADGLRAACRGRVQNMYGPTETTIWSTTHVLDAPARTPAAIGTPIANTQVYVVTDAGAPVPVGIAGELLIGGAGVTRGYWNRADTTAERFVPDTHGSGRMLYRTGDLVRWTEEGRLEFLGRTDHQVKIRGHRIELGEIEARLAAIAGVDQAVVCARDRAGDAARDTQLVGYVTARAPVTEDALRAELARDLPDIMVPARIVTLESFPLTPNKKIDRKALPDPKPPAQAGAPSGDQPPVTDTQAAIARIWERILGV